MQTLQRAQHGREIAALKVAAAALVTEQRIDGEKAVTDPDDGRAGRVTGRCHVGRGHAAERHLGALIRQNIRRILHIIACQSAELTHVVPAQQPGVLLRHNILCAGGFEYLVRHSGIDVAGQKALVLGNGGASATIQAVLEQLGAHVTVISRHRPDNYENLDRHADAHVIVNTTPVGMYPNTGKAAVDLRQFPQCAGVLDIVYNPARTALLLQAERLGIPCAGGLYMLVAQAKRSCEVFTGTVIDDAQILRIHRLLRQEMENIVLIGMPGSGKSTIAALLAERLHRPVLDSDAQIVETAGVSIPDIFAAGGEDAFRARETAALAELGKRSGAVLATGGGCVCREENYPLLHQNGTIFWLQRDLALLPKDGRPISQRSDLAALYAQRAPLYARFADAVIDNNGTPEETVQKILEVLA